MEQELEEKGYEGQRSLKDAKQVSYKGVVSIIEANEDRPYKAIYEASVNMAEALFIAYEDKVISSSFLRTALTDTVRACAGSVLKKRGPGTTEKVTQFIVLYFFHVYMKEKRELKSQQEELANALR